MHPRVPGEPSARVVVGSLSALIGATALSACLLSGYEQVDDAAGGASSTGGGSSTSRGAGGAGGNGTELPTCETTRIPKAPDGGSQTSVPETFFALRAIRFGRANEPAEVPGFDLDGADGCQTDCQGNTECGLPEFVPDLDPDEEAQRCDFPRGVDNSGVHLFDRIAFYLGSDDQDFTDQANLGAWSLIVRLRAWNGEPDDATVELALFATTGFESNQGEGGGTTGATTTSTTTSTGGAEPGPLWDGNDVWSIDQRSLEVGFPDLEHPSFVDTGAYVADGVLVAALGGTFYAGTNQIPIALEDGILVAPIVGTASAPRIEDAVFSGRWPVQTLIDALGPLEFGAASLCQTGELFTNAIGEICKLVDVTEDGNPGACDALSLAFELDASPILPGTIVDPDTQPIVCPPISCASVFGN